MKVTDWVDISEAPKGVPVYVKRVYNGKIVKEGMAIFASLGPDAPMRQPVLDNGLWPPLPPDHESADREGWCNIDRLHRFPSPTHYSLSMSALEKIKEGK
jgi:hypothetical protein